MFYCISKTALLTPALLMPALINWACAGGTLERGAPMENGVGAGSADVKIKWSALSFDISLERGALFHSEMGSERGAAIEK